VKHIFQRAFQGWTVTYHGVLEVHLTKPMLLENWDFFTEHWNSYYQTVCEQNPDLLTCDSIWFAE
jgi:hypothetical protein